MISVSETSSPATGAATGTFLTIVSGLPRSGTALMMMLLEAGGVLVLFDTTRRCPECSAAISPRSLPG